MGLFRWDGSQSRYKNLRTGEFLDPDGGVEPGSARIAHIGDSTSDQNGLGAARVPAALAAVGWNEIYFWGVGSKTLTGTDAQGKNTFQNIDEVRATGEPDLWLINLGANNSGSSDNTNTNLLGQVLNYLGPNAKVKWCGLSQSDSLSASTTANRVRFNRLARTMIDRRPNMEWVDWHAWIKGYEDAQYWVSDNVHMTTAGYALKNKFFAESAGRPPSLPVITRMEGADYVRYEDLYVAGDDMHAVTQKAGGKIITLPPDPFVISGFKYANQGAGLRSGTTSTQVCRGFSGTVDSDNRPLTTIQMEPFSSARTTGGTVMQFWQQRRVVIERLGFLGADQGHDYAGVSFLYCPSPTVRNVYAKGFNQGSDKEPPGETFGFNFYISDNGTLRDSDLDGRRPDGVRVSTSMFGWNTSKNAYVRNVYAHHGKAGMGTWWETTDIHTVDLRNFSQASGSGKNSGAALNMEKVGGVIRHIRTELGLDRAGGNTGFHIGLNNSTGAAGSPSFGDATDVQILELKHDPGRASLNGGLEVNISATYHGDTQTQVTNPLITLASAPNTALIARNSTDQSNPNPLTQYWVFR